MRRICGMSFWKKLTGAALTLFWILILQAAVMAAPAKVTGLNAEAIDSEGIRLTWNAAPGAAGYIVYMEDLQNKTELMRVNQPTCEVRVTANGAPLTTGMTYGFSVCAYEKDISVGASEGAVILGESSEKAEAAPVLKAPENLAYEGLNKKVIRLTWQTIPDADGYEIWRSNNKLTGFKKITTIKRGTTARYDNKKLKSNKVYYYKMRTFKKNGSRTLQSEFTEVLPAATKVKAPKLTSAKVTGGDTVLLKWKKSDGAEGYVIYRSTTKKKGYKKVMTVNGGKTTSAYVSGNKSGATYYYKIKACGNKKLTLTYSAYSNIKTATFNLLSFENETVTQKCQRIFGTNSYKKYASEAEAAANMSTIRVAVWDFASDGVTKVTKYKNVTVHKNIAPTVEQIFKEIYEGKEQFPIKSVGGYSYRGATSTSEHCEGLAIDINWEENYMIDNGKILSGKLYQPGVNPYSIPTNGEVAKIMKKYGFSQGLWPFKNRYDYMHFSYFGR